MNTGRGLTSAPDQSPDERPELLPGAPLSARVLFAALPLLDPGAVADVRAGRENSRRTRRALAHLVTSGLGVAALSRQELSVGARYLRDLDARTGCLS